MREAHSPREPGIGRLTRIPIRDNGEPLVDLCEIRPVVVEACPTYVRETVARMVARAAGLLPEGIRLRVHTALRTTDMQTRGYWGHYEDLRKKHPTWPRSVLRRQANRFWHPPDVPKAPPGHCTGGAVDVGLLDPEGTPLDVTSVTRQGADPQPTYALHLTPEAKANRALLIRVMTEAGFSNCYDEWWHWSYGDCAWAVRHGHPEAIYGWVTELPEAVLRQIEEKRNRDEAARLAASEATPAPDASAGAERAVGRPADGEAPG